MDDQLKARLIGAVILVTVAVVLIPELLSGRKSAAPETAAAGEGRGMRTVVIDLTGAAPAQSAPEPRPEPKPDTTVTPAALPPPVVPQPGPAERVAAEPAGAQTVAAEPPKAAPVAKAAEPLPSPKVEPVPVEPKPAKAPGKGGWSVQVGAFGSSATAGKLVSDLKSAGYKAYISPISKGGKTLHRVRVGPEAVRSDADRLAVKLKGRNLPATVVAND